jgi:Uma2 family endonuclease
MPTTTVPAERILTLGDLLNRLGGISPCRVRAEPPPGQATARDVIGAEARENRLYELVDGTLVEKAMGFNESLLAGALIAFLRAFVIPRNLGLVSGESGMMRILPDLIRIPDAAFISWDRLPGKRIPDTPIPQIAPDLVAEILSQSNTPAEMSRKRAEYFEAGVRLIWDIDPRNRTVAVYSAPDRVVMLTESQILDGGEVLCGFRLPLTELFAELDRFQTQS